MDEQLKEKPTSTDSIAPVTGVSKTALIWTAVLCVVLSSAISLGVSYTFFAKKRVYSPSSICEYDCPNRRL